MRESAIEQGLFEVLAIGIGATAALVGACLGVLQVKPEDLKAFPGSVAVILLLAFSYALGIAVDRLANRLLSPVGSLVLRRAGIPRLSPDQLAKSRSKMSDDDRDRESYARTRLRIVRGWAVVLPACAISLTVYLSLTPIHVAHKARVIGTAWIAIGMLAYLMFFAFADLTKSLHRALQRTDFGAPVELNAVGDGH
jgi:hypothetical protein